MPSNDARSTDLKQSEPDAATKHIAAADIINRVLVSLLNKAVASANVYQLCVDGDAEIEALARQIYKTVTRKGVSFPTCISVNHCACHYAPATDTGLVLKDGDLVKIELGAHIDTYPALLAHSFIVGASKNAPATDKRADLMEAAHHGVEAALRLFRQGKTNTEVSETVHKIIDAYHVKAIEGTISFQMSKNSLGGSKHVILNPTDAQKKSVETCTFEDGDVFAVDIAVSSSEGRIKAGSERPTIYKRTENNYALKLKSSRATLTEIMNKHGSMAFTIRSLGEEGKGKLGLVECINHQLVQPYEPLYETEGEQIARFMFTVIVTPVGPLRITNHIFDPSTTRSQYKIEDTDLKALLSSEVRKPKPDRKTGVADASTPAAVAAAPKK